MRFIPENRTDGPVYIRFRNQKVQAVLAIFFIIYEIVYVARTISYYRLLNTFNSSDTQKTLRMLIKLSNLPIFMIYNPYISILLTYITIKLIKCNHEYIFQKLKIPAEKG
jgi:hypothetical protein